MTYISYSLKRCKIISKHLVLRFHLQKSTLEIKMLEHAMKESHALPDEDFPIR